MNKWSTRLYDRAMEMISSSKLQKMREKVIAKSSGSVLEIGAGTGINFSLYSPNNVNAVYAIDPNTHHLQRAEIKRKQAKVPVHLYDAKAEHLPFQDDKFDTIICMLVFCTITDPVRAISEIERVAKSGAMVLFLEHVKVDRLIIGTAQNMFNPLWKRIADGCHLNRHTKKLIENSSLNIVESESFYKDVFKFIRCKVPESKKS